MEVEAARDEALHRIGELQETVQHKEARVNVLEAELKKIASKHENALAQHAVHSEVRISIAGVEWSRGWEWRERGRTHARARRGRRGRG